MNKNISKFLSKINEAHECFIKGDTSKYNRIIRSQTLTKEESSDSELMKRFNEGGTNDWQKIAIIGILLNRGYKDFAKEQLEVLMQSKDMQTRFDARALLNLIIPQLEKEGKV